MKSLKEYIKDREMRQTGGMPESADFHSKGYHRYFEGYSEYKTVKPNGKMQIKRVYTGVYHRQELNHAQRIWLRILYCTFFCMSLALFLLCAARYVPSNYCWYVAAAEAVSVAGLFWVLCSLANYITAGENMTQYEYRCVGRLKKAVKCASAALLGVSAATAAYLLLHRQEYLLQEALCAVSALGASAICFSIYMVEERIVYTSFLSKNKAPEDSNQIGP